VATFSDINSEFNLLNASLVMPPGFQFKFFPTADSWIDGLGGGTIEYPESSRYRKWKAMLETKVTKKIPRTEARGT
jgi:hypothetical protein